jgi:hypothetical protein
MKTAFRFVVVAALAVMSVSAADPSRKNTSEYTIGESVQPLVIIGEGWSGMVWFSLLGEFPQLAGFEGQLKVYCEAFAAAFSLQFTPNGAFTAVPVVHTFGQ